ncbi:MAG: serine/threonine protein kinase [Myxococcales bacterium]|nr:serine/threonine protein kinase [Myxococcales bacterium]
MQKAQQLGRYHLLDRLAYGGMAEIYRAQTFDAKGRVHFVAIKRVLAHLAEDNDFIQMMIDEASIASSLRHPNIARVYEFARAGHEYFIAMEHVDGKDLRSTLERCRQTKTYMSPKHVAFIAAEAAAALHSAHAAVDAAGEPLRIIHRDVSPSNILLSYSGDVKLCDFGIAKATLSKVQTKTGVIKGKVKYMSPEQALGRKLDHRSDIFSLGSVIYEMLTRVPPFVASSEMGLLLKVRDAKYQPISEGAPAVPPELEAICDKCLTRVRGERYQTAAELEADLRAFLRKYVPGYNRSHLAHYIRGTFADDIDRELRMLEEFVLSEEVSDDVGENLIAQGGAVEEVPFVPKRQPTAAAVSAQRSAARHPNTMPKPVDSAIPEHIDRAPTRPEPMKFDAIKTAIDAEPFGASVLPLPRVPGAGAPTVAAPAVPARKAAPTRPPAPPASHAPATKVAPPPGGPGAAPIPRATRQQEREKTVEGAPPVHVEPTLIIDRNAERLKSNKK